MDVSYTFRHVGGPNEEEREGVNRDDPCLVPRGSPARTRGCARVTVDKVQHVNAPALAEVAGPVASDSQECW